MTPRCALSLLLLAVPALPQGGDRPAAATIAKPGDADQLFYRAFYLHRGERRYEQALALYREFLAAAPDSRYAARAVDDAAAILNRSGKADEARQLRDRYSGDKAKPPAAEVPATTEAARADTPPARDQRAMTDAEKTRAQEQLTELKAQLAKAEESGEERNVQRLGQQIQRLERQLESGMVSAAPRGGRASGQRGQARGNRRQVSFVDMDADQIAQQLERMERLQSTAIERLKESGQTEQADKIEKQWTQMKKLLDEGKPAEAQKIYDEVMTSMRRRRG